MTTWTEARNAVRTKMRALAGSYGWSLLEGNSPNQKIPTGFYVRFEMLGGGSAQITTGATGGRRFRYAHVAQATVYAKLERGEKDAQEAIDAIKDEFKAVTEDGITYRTPSVDVLGADATHYAFAVTIPYQFDEVA